jgi:hypothetical protein
MLAAGKIFLLDRHRGSSLLSVKQSEYIVLPGNHEGHETDNLQLSRIDRRTLVKHMDLGHLEKVL